MNEQSYGDFCNECDKEIHDDGTEFEGKLYHQACIKTVNERRSRHLREAIANHEKSFVIKHDPEDTPERKEKLAEIDNRLGTGRKQE